MRCLILGANGLVGSQVATVCVNRGYAHLGTWYRRPHSEMTPVDVRDEHAVNDLIADYQPDVTILAAGITSAGYAEQFADETRSVHVDGTRIVAEAVARHGGTLVTFSPDTVFGECKQARREEDPAAGTGEHPAGKLEAEAIVRNLLPDRHLIVRTGWLYGPDERHRGLLGAFARHLAANEPIEAAADRFGQPTYAPDLAAAALDLAQRGKTGTFHVVGPDKHTEATFARLVCHVFGYDIDLVAELPAERMEFVEPRPSRVWLDRFKARSALGSKVVRSTADGLRETRAALVASAEIRLARAA